MAERNPPSWLQAGSHPSEHDRLAITGLLGGTGREGVVGAGALAVAQNGTPNMSVNVAAGAAFVDNDLAGFGGTYHVQNDATVNRAIAASDPTNPRRDLVVVRIRDAAYFGATNSWDLFVITGTPAAVPVDPAIPADGSYLLLARVAVAAGATSITNANITDLRVQAPVGRAPTMQVFTSSGSWMKPPGLKAARVRVVGGGGGGGGAATTGAGQAALGGCGGGGGYAEEIIPAAALGPSETVTVGASGSGGAAGNNSGSAGGTSSFGSHASAAGGAGAAGSAAVSGFGVAFGGNGGAATIGAILVGGGAGSNGILLSGQALVAGSAGSSVLGGGPRYLNISGNGLAGAPFGAGGSGGVNGPSSGTARSGGAGASGVVIVENIF